MESLGELETALTGIQTDGHDPLNEREGDEEALPLLHLPDACLLTVMRCCADDQHSLFSAARAHSRLHQAALLALSSISIVLDQQEQADSVLQYLAQHGQNVSSINLSMTYPYACETPTSEGPAPPTVTLHELPHGMQGLSSITLERVHLHLQPGNGFHGVVRPGTPVELLRLDRCRLVDGEEGLAAALSLLPGLQHLSCDCINSIGSDSFAFRFPVDALQDLQQLTYLELQGGELQGQDGMQHLEGLTNLQDLRLCPSPYSSNGCTITASVLSGAHHMTRLELDCVPIASGILSGKTRLQHLEFAAPGTMGCDIAGGWEGVQELLGHLQSMKQLTHLSLGRSLKAPAPAAAYSALTASSKLHHLNLCDSTLPAGVWQHIFPTSKQLLNLLYLGIADIFQTDAPAAAPECSRLVSCCPGLQSLHMCGLQYSSELLAPLTGLGSLTDLSICPAGESTQGLEVVCQFTGLRQLFLSVNGDARWLLAQLTQLQQLTSLTYFSPDLIQRLSCQAPGDEPVWQQLLHHLPSEDIPAGGVGQQVAAGAD